MKTSFFRPAVMAAIASATMSASASDAWALAYPCEGLQGSPVSLDYWRFYACDDLESPEGSPVTLDFWRF